MADKKSKNKKQDINVQRSKRKKQKKKSSAGKIIITIISLLVVGIVAFVATVKVMMPDLDLKQFVPQQVIDFVSTEVMNKLPAEELTTEETTTEATTKPLLNYLEEDNFKFNTAKQGNYLGNLLNGGKVATDLTYIYYVVDGEGIYRFNPNTEAYTLFYADSNALCSMNLRGDYIYFVNENTNQLYKLQKGKKEAKAVAEGVKTAYVYDSNVYYITVDNSLCVMDVKELTPTTVYYSADDTLDFVGISLDRVFFTVTESDGTVNYLTIDNFAHKSHSEFRESTASGEIMSMEMENGFMYYYLLQADGTYNLCRQKFGSERVVTLAENTGTTQYAIVDSNRLFYSEIDGDKLKMRELNMNSGDKKTLLKVGEIDKSALPAIQHGWQYDFIIGSGYYSASCIDTSSTNVMSLNENNKWKY